MGASAQACKQSCCGQGDVRPPNGMSTTDENYGTQKPSDVPGLSLPTLVETSDARGDLRQASYQEDVTDFSAPMPVPEGLERRQAEREEAAAKEKETEKLNKAREKKEREAKEKAERLAKDKATQEAREKAELEKKEREAKEREALAAKAGMPMGSKLEICLDNGWQPVSDEEFKQVQNHLAGGETKFAIQARGAMYVVDFTDPNNPTQANAMTNKARKLRVLK